ncbi:MAG: outer membrane protein TolC [Desulforhopalus sp.]
MDYQIEIDELTMKRRLLLFTTIFLVVIFVKHVRAESLTLTLDEVTRAALENNLGLQLERLNPKIQQENLIASEAEYDTSFSLEGTSGKTNTDETFSDKETIDYGASTGLSKKFLFGTDVSATFDWTDKEIEQGPNVADGDTATATLVVSQPLLKNRGTEVNRRLISLAENDLSVADLSLKQTLIDTVAEAKNLYWNYYYALAFFEVQKSSLALAESSLDEITERIRLGSSPKLDLLQAKAEVAAREEGVISSENSLFNAQDQLLNYIYGSITTADRVEPGDPPALHVVDKDENELLEQAYSLRTELLVAKLQLASAETDITYFDNQRLPQLDLSATIMANDGDAGTTIDSTDFAADNFEDYQYAGVGLSLELPIGRRLGNANHAAALLKKRQNVIDQQNIRSMIKVEVRAALRTMKASYKRYKAAALSKEYAVESLATEEEKYRSGLSTSYQVMLFQRDLTDARASEIDAVADYQMAIIALYKAVGITLEQNNIRFDEVVQ